MEDGRSRLSSTIPLARTLSVAGHPFVLIPLTVALTTRSLRWAAIIAAGTILPLLWIIVRNVRRGTWSDAGVSRHDQRASFYDAAGLVRATHHRRDSRWSRSRGKRGNARMAFNLARMGVVTAALGRQALDLKCDSRGRPSPH
jgi:hypothetical protein